MSDPVERTDRPTISVIVGAYSRQLYLTQAVRSVLDQTLDRSRYEIVVIKNFECSEVDDLRDRPGVKILWDDSAAMGTMLARAVHACDGEVICFLDDDDLFEPGKLSLIADRFREIPNLSFVHDGLIAVDRTGAQVPDWERFRPQPPVSYLVATPADRRARTPEFFRYGSNVNMSAMSVRTTLLLKVAERLSGIGASPDIFVFFAALAGEGSLWIERDRLTRYRFHSSSSHAEVDAGGGSFEAKRLLAEVQTAQVIADMTQGTPAETAAAGYVIEARFQLYLMDPRATPPTWRQHGTLLYAAWTRRQAYLADRALWALLKRIAPERVTRAYRRRSQARQLRMIAA